MDFLKEWEEKLNIKITCSQVWACWLRLGLGAAGSHRAWILSLGVGEAGHDKNTTRAPGGAGCGGRMDGGTGDEAAGRGDPVPHPACAPQEPEPMGTAGPLALAREILDNDSNTPFFVLNRWVAVGLGGRCALCIRPTLHSTLPQTKPPTTPQHTLQ